MSRRNYIEAARIIREASYLTPDARRQLVADLVTWFADANPRFSPTKFRAACEPEQSERDQLEARGHADRKAAGTWVIDGNTSDDTCRVVLAGMDLRALGRV
jgi:hypothetical protein